MILSVFNNQEHLWHKDIKAERTGYVNIGTDINVASK